MERDHIPKDRWERAIDEMRDQVARRLTEKGDGACASIHEAWGVLDEEVQEFKEAVQQKDRLNARAELLDIVVAALWALASLEAEADRPCSGCGKVGHSAWDHTEVRA